MEFRRRPPLDFHVEISPLIDVVFLLLIFFMVSTTFVEEAALEVQLPESGSTVERPEEPMELIVRADGSISLGNVPVAEQDLEAALRKAFAENPDRALLVKGDERVPHGKMVHVYDAVVASGGTSMVLDAVPKDSGASAP